MSKFDPIRPYYDSEVNETLKGIVSYPMMKALMHFTFPETPEEEWKNQLMKTHSIRDFQCNFIYHAARKVIEKSSDGLTTSGFENLEKNTSYLFISNHRDIILDTSLLNVALFEHGLVMTASAIGDNLVKKDFLLKLSKLNRNFLVQRGLTPRELLLSSKLLSEYIQQMLVRENRSVWIAQREGRTKDGNDQTQQGVLKMIALAGEVMSPAAYIQKLKVVPVSISYEYDPTDMLKMPQLLAQSKNELYIKEKNEDFITLMSGIMGQKKRIHIHIGNVLNQELKTIENEFEVGNKQLQAISQVIDDAIIQGYKLWSTNYIAYDLLKGTDTFKSEYTEDEKMLFERRLEMRIDGNDTFQKESFLAMYANPVINQKKLVHA
ncbi:MAG: 1-acyl-sn-glycerol-3-phosphate acyltransferase [Flavobacterium sp.]